MFKRFGVLVAVIGFAMSAYPASAITLPINENAGAPAVTSLQQTVSDIANGAAQIVASIEAAVGSILGAITDRLAGVDPSSKTLSFTASAAAATAPTPAAANTADEPIVSTSPTFAPLPPSATTTQVIVEKEQPVVEAAPSVSSAQFSALLGSLHNLLVLLPGAAPPASGGGNADLTTTQQEIAALQREVAQTNQINNLSNVTLTSPSIVSPSIAGLSTSQVSEGSNLYFTNARVASYIDSSTTIPSVAGGAAGNVLSWNGFAWIATATSSLGVLGSQWTALGNSLSYTTGNVGIGTTSPSALLSIDSSSATGTILRISNHSTGGHVFDLLSTGSGNTNGAGRLDIFDSTAGQARLSIAANGNVGVGTTSPFAAFAVAGNAFLSGNLSVGDPATTRSNLGLSYASTPDLIGSVRTSGDVVITAWGDSLTAGNQDGTGNTYPIFLSSISGYWVQNDGVSGQTSPQILSRFVSAHQYRQPTIIWSGKNDFYNSISVATTEANIASMVAALQSAGNNNYIVMSVLNSSNEPSGNATYTAIMGLNSYLASTYGSHYLDIRTYLVQQAIYDAGLTPTAQDLTDISNDVIPTQLRYDTTHVTSVGYNQVAKKINSVIATLVPSGYNANSVLTLSGLKSVLSTSLNVAGFIDTDRFSGFQQDGKTILFASSTSYTTLVGMGAGASFLTSSVNNTAVGYQALYIATSSATYNTAVGSFSLANNTSGSANVAVGDGALTANTTGSSNVAIGQDALFGATTASYNTAVGRQTMQSNSTGYNNATLGFQTLYNNTTGANNTAVGYQALKSNTSGNNSTAVGTNALVSSVSTSGENSGFGEEALNANTSGSNNTAMAYRSLYTNSSGSYNTAVGVFSGKGGGYIPSDADTVSDTQMTFIGAYASRGTAIASTSALTNGTAIGYGAQVLASNQVVLGNNSVTSTLLNGRVGIGTTTPYSRLEVWGPDQGTTSAFMVVNSGSTTAFTVYDSGNAMLGGSLVQNSDQRLKTNIADLDGSSSLAEIEALSPVTFNWIDPAKSSVPQYGFIAQQVQSVFPNLVSVTAPTALTPDGTLSLNYIDLISPIVAAIHQLDKEITSLASTVAGFAESFTTKQLTFVRGQGNEIDVQTANVQKLCIGSTCVTEAQLQALLASANQSSAAPSPSSEATDTPPAIAINGDNPAVVQVGASYSDLGATITGPQADLNLGIKTFLNGALVSSIVLDTSAVATDTIDYVVTDSQGLTSTSTRTVIIEPATVPLPVSSASASSTAAIWSAGA